MLEVSAEATVSIDTWPSLSYARNISICLFLITMSGHRC